MQLGNSEYDHKRLSLIVDKALYWKISPLLILNIEYTIEDGSILTLNIIFEGFS